MSSTKLRQALRRAAKISRHSERAVEIAAVVAEALREIDQDPILVGGAAVEFYTDGGYSTQDIDMVAEGGPDLIQQMKQLGFERLGKDFIHHRLKIYIEFPSRSLKPDEQYITLQLKNRSLKIISLEDLVVDRLCAYKFWKSSIDGLNTLLLMERVEIDSNRLQRRVKQENVIDVLEKVQMILQEVVRKKLSREQASQLLLSDAKLE